MQLEQHIEDAAFEAHMAAVESLKGSLGRKPSATEVTHCLAAAYGEAFALASVVGATNDELVKSGRIYSESFKAMVSKLHARTCEGTA